jgi:hypothetical protein
MYAVIIAVLATVLPGTHADAQEELTWVTVEGIASIGQAGREEARTRALDDAMRQAREQVIGSSISVESLAINMKLSGGIASAIPYLRITEKQILEEGVTSAGEGKNAATSLMYRVVVKAGVAEERAGADASFRVEASLNKSSFKNGEEMQIHIKPTRDCHVSVFIIMEDGKALRLLPNRFKSDISLKAGKAFSFPDAADKQKGITLVAHADDHTVKESLYVLALNQPFSYDVRFQEGIYGIYDGNTAFLNDLVSEIVGIPLGDRAEKLVQYQIMTEAKGGAR